MNSSTLLVSGYSPAFVVVSFAVSMIGAFIALLAAPRIADAKGHINRLDLFASALALGGLGVWTMHFVGMLALRLDVGLGYSTLETGLSLLASVVSTGFALAFVARGAKTLKRMFIGGLVMGLGVGAMHYIGMYSLRFGGFINWSIPVVAVSLLIAVVASTAALWLAFNTPSFTTRLAAAIVMAIAVCAMHYTGMSAADFICTTDDRLAVPGGSGIVSATGLPGLVGIVSLGLIFMLSLDLMIQHFSSKPVSRR